MVSKRKYILTIVAVVLVTAFLTLTLGNVLLVEIGQKVFLSKDEYSQLKKISEKYAKQESIMKIAQNEFLYEADEEVMLEGALQGTLKALGDPYTQFLTKEEFESLMQDTEGSYEGIGVYITAGDDNKIIIVSPIEDTPAEKAGLRTGDKITRINGIEYTADQIDAAVKVMKGEPGTSVTLTIQRAASDGTQDISDIVINREKIRIKTVKPAMLGDDIGYIRVTTFDMQTAKDFKAAYSTLKNRGLKGLVIDLRFNPGGMISTTVEIADMFMGEGIVTYTKTKAGEIEYFKSDDKMEDIPIVILINEGSASASEIMAGAMKDTNRAVLIGQKTFGKGIVQKVQRFGNDGEGIKMTISEYFTPAGINIHGVGIEPDIEIQLPEDAEGYGYDFYETDTQLQKAVEVLRK
ncbi:MAG: S41 family peptidase [Tissierellia bacterium]|jgi:carboxyl-terminal processing protease|nr:S41 family peptidase [Sedimentibacter sp.]NLA13317.1 S41 family peptidase [Tissierellia bacterium]HAS92625.1 S41 family peptidase [Clostridiales bacterium]HOA20527.1 S41 family peptidase [Sedimentibacter sp.]HPY57146.1 S41 family peptidase [Sedimentibacter sp.]